MQTSATMQQQIKDGKTLFDYCLDRYRQTSKEYCEQVGQKYQEPNVNLSGFLLIPPYGPVFVARNNSEVLGVLVFDDRTGEYEPIDFKTDENGKLDLASLRLFT